MQALGLIAGLDLCLTQCFRPLLEPAVRVLPPVHQVPLLGPVDPQGLRSQQGRRLRHNAGLQEADGPAGEDKDKVKS